VSGELLQARDRGHAIVDEAADRQVDAIVMGVGFERTLGEFHVGTAAQYVLTHAPCQVLLYREPVRE
jgi:nucleotide-binding universal stress UspA family protein